MAKEKKGSGIQQAAGLIRYFDEESEDAIQISRGMIYFLGDNIKNILLPSNLGNSSTLA